MPVIGRRSGRRPVIGQRLIRCGNDMTTDHTVVEEKGMKGGHFRPGDIGQPDHAAAVIDVVGFGRIAGDIADILQIQDGPPRGYLTAPHG